MRLATAASTRIPILRFLAVFATVMLAGLSSLPPIGARAEAAPLLAHAYRMAGDAQRTRIVLHFDRDPEPRFFLLRSPYRLVIDLPATKFVIDPDETNARGMVTSVRYGRMGEDTSRLVLSLDCPFEVENLQIIENETSPGFRLVADIVATSTDRFDTALAEQIASTGSTKAAGKADRLGKTEDTGKPFTIVIDPGHGGIDGGAEGVSGIAEKEITLTFATELQKKLSETGKYRVFLTRDSDVFLRLDERVRIARQHEADLFVSVHADTIRLRGIRGATVYTVSDRASDAESAATAMRENLSDQLAGFEIEDEDHAVADILADLIRRETHSFSMRFARSLVGELSNTIELINNPHRFAGFRVLKAPDVPSVLLELGYLSNAKDEEQLRNPEWRGKAIDSLVSAIDLFSADRARLGG